MTIADQFSLALEFMVLGMGVVFGFLTFLVLVVKWMGQIAQKLERSRVPAVAPPLPDSPGLVKTTDETVAAVITAAVHQYRRQFLRDRT